MGNHLISFVTLKPVKVVVPELSPTRKRRRVKDIALLFSESLTLTSSLVAFWRYAGKY